MFRINYSEKSQKIVDWLQKTVHNAGFEKVVIALSGGIDSAVSATLAVRALGKENVIVLLLPYGSLSDKGTRDAKDVAEFLDLPAENIIICDIKKAVDNFELNSDRIQKVSGSDKSDISDDLKLRLGNIMARVRMIYLYDFAKATNSLVVGTENKSEYYLGYFTRFGDEASDIEPIRNLYKTQVWEMGKYLGIPEHIIQKAPSAGLWEGQSDEDEFGFSYADADRVLYHHFDEGLGEEAIIDLGIPENIVKSVLQWVAKNDFKHKLPYIFS